MRRFYRCVGIILIFIVYSIKTIYIESFDEIQIGQVKLIVFNL